MELLVRDSRNDGKVAVLETSKVVADRGNTCTTGSTGGNETGRVMGVLGPYSSASSKEVQEYLRLPSVTVAQVGYSATAPDLGNLDHDQLSGIGLNARGG